MKITTEDGEILRETHENDPKGLLDRCANNGRSRAVTTASTSSTSTKKITLPGHTTTATATTTSTGSTATGSSVSGEGYFYAYYEGSQDGELISEGTWYYGGTPATYHATASGTSRYNCNS